MFMDWISLVMEKLLFLALHVEGIGTFPKPLSAEEERKCFEEMRQGSEEARGKLVEHNLRLVAHIAKKYYALSGDQDDLILSLIHISGTLRQACRLRCRLWDTASCGTILR